MSKQLVKEAENATKTVLSQLKPSESPFYVVAAFGSFALVHTAGAMPNMSWFPPASLVALILIWAVVGAIKAANGPSDEWDESQVRFSRASAISSGLLALAVGGPGASHYPLALGALLLLCACHCAIFISRFASTRLNRGANGAQLSILMGLLLLGSSHSLSQHSLRREALLSGPRSAELDSDDLGDAEVALEGLAVRLRDLDRQIERLSTELGEFESNTPAVDSMLAASEAERIPTEIRKTLEAVQETSEKIHLAAASDRESLSSQDDWKRAVKLMAEAEQPLSVKGAALTLFATFAQNQNDEAVREILSDAAGQRRNFAVSALTFIALWLLACISCARPKEQPQATN